MNRSIKRIIKENKISQIYVSNALSKTKSIFLRDINFCEYKDKNKSSLFIGMYNINDFNIVKNHKSKKYILWPDNNLELSNMKSLFIKSIKLDCHYCLKSNVYRILKDKIPHIICLDKEYINVKLIDLPNFIKENKISQLFVSVSSDLINNKIMNYKFNNENTLFWGLDTNVINVIKNHVGKKWILYDTKFEIISKKLDSLLNLLPKTEGHLCINNVVYENIKKRFNNVLLTKYFDINCKRNFNFVERKNIRNENQLAFKKNNLKESHNTNINKNKVNQKNLPNINSKKSISNTKILNKKELNNKNVNANANRNLKVKKIKEKDQKNIKNRNVNLDLKKNVQNQSKITNNLVNKQLNIKSYPTLFNKYLLNLVNPNRNINYEIKNENNDNDFIKRKYFAHLHCFDLSKFYENYSSYIEDIKKYFSIIVTYSIGLQDIDSNFTLLKIENRGMDLGAKFCMVEYLNKKEIKFDYILFLHSKSNSIKRHNYFSSLVNNIPYFLKKINLTQDIGAFVPPLILNGNNGYFLNNEMFNNNLKFKNNWGKNSIYMNDLIKYFDLDSNFYLFPEGNCYILHKKIVNILFSDKLLYNLLNTQKTFDYSWVKNSYNFLKNEGPAKIYKKYMHLNLMPNNINTSTDSLFYLADSMIEHTFERMIFLFLKKLNLNLEIFFKFNKETSSNYNNIINRYIKSNKTNFNFINLNQNKSNDLIIIACHTDSQLKVYSLIYNLNFFTKISQKVIIVNSKELIHLNLEKQIVKHFNEDFITSNNITFKYYDNDCYLCQGKWFYCLSEINYKNYKNIILTNDSYILYNSLNYFKDIWDEDIEMSTLLTSSEKRVHDTDFLRRYNQEGLKKIIDYYSKNINKKINNLKYEEIIDLFEISSSDIFDSKNHVYFEKDNININFEDSYLSEYLLKKNYPIIKIKKIIKSNKIDFISHILKNKRFNFLNFL